MAATKGSYCKQLALAGGGVVGEACRAGAGRQLLDAVRLASLQARTEDALQPTACLDYCLSQQLNSALERDAAVHSDAAMPYSRQCVMHMLDIHAPEHAPQCAQAQPAEQYST